MDNKNQKFCDILLTDIQFHMCEPRKPLSPVRTIEKSLRNNKPGRWYNKNLPMPKKDGTFTIPIFENSEIGRFIKRKEAEGMKIRIFMPKSGLFAYAGKDTVEFIKAHHKRAFDRAR